MHSKRFEQAVEWWWISGARSFMHTVLHSVQ